MYFRPVEGSDERFMPLLGPDPASILTAGQYGQRRASREYRPEWTWTAAETADADAAPPLAVAVWWGDPRAALPGALDGIFVQEQVEPASRTALAAELLGAAHRSFAAAGAEEPPAYHVFLPSDWHERADVLAALSWRQEAARRAGLSDSLERLQYEWTERDGVPETAGRLRFRAEPDDEVFVGLFRRVLAGTLDATSQRGASRIGPDAQARAEVMFYRDSMLGERSWWRVAETPDRQAVGFAVPSRNTQYPVIGYLGVLPEHRGHRYAAEILAEITRILVTEAAATTIRADTDLQNRPMAAAFEQVGYRNIARRLVLSAP